MNIINIKRGDTFGFSMTLTNDSNVAITGQALNLKCQIRDGNDVLVDTMVITESDTLGTYIFRAGSTLEWHGSLFFDIQYTDADSIVASSDAVGIMVREDVTKA